MKRFFHFAFRFFGRVLKRLWLAPAMVLLPFAVVASDCPRIVSQAPYITRSLEWLGLADCIVGVGRYDHLSLPRTGGILDPDESAIAALKPDLLFNADWIDDAAMKKVTPPGSRYYRLHGFQSMAQIEENLGLIGTVVELPDTERRVAAFRKDWRETVAQVNGGGRTALLLSACSGQPYSFGRDTYLYDLFTQAGFRIVETEPGIRLMTGASPEAEIGALVNQLRPDLLFLFGPKQSEQCPLLAQKLAVRQIHLDGNLFLDPAPTLIEGLKALSELTP